MQLKYLAEIPGVITTVAIRVENLTLVESILYSLYASKIPSLTAANILALYFQILF